MDNILIRAPSTVLKIGNGDLVQTKPETESTIGPGIRRPIIDDYEGEKFKGQNWSELGQKRKRPRLLQSTAIDRDSKNDQSGTISHKNDSECATVSMEPLMLLSSYSELNDSTSV